MSGRLEEPLVAGDPTMMRRSSSGGFNFQPNARRRTAYRTYLSRQATRWLLHLYRIVFFPLIGFFYLFAGLRLFFAQMDVQNQMLRRQRRLERESGVTPNPSELVRDGTGGASSDFSPPASRQASALIEPAPDSPNNNNKGCCSAVKNFFIILLTANLFRPSTRHLTLPNQYDWLIICVVGATFQLAVFGPVYHFEGDFEEHYTKKSPTQSQLPSGNTVPTPVEYSVNIEAKQHAADYYGPLIFYPVIALFLIWIGVAFNHYSRRERKARREIEMNAQIQSDVRIVNEDLVHIRSLVRLRSWLLFPFTLVITLIEVGLIRTDVSEWSDFIIAGTIFWFIFLFSLNLVMWFGLVILYQQRQLLRSFTADPERVEQLLRLEEGRENVARWALVWQQLVVDVRKQPLVKSVSTPSGVLLLLQIGATAAYLVIRNLFGRDRHQYDVFLPGVACVGVHAVICFAAYIVITVSVQRTIEDQHKEIGRLQNDVQSQIEVFNENERDYADLQMMRSKVRVLQSLDRFLHAADPRPRFLSLSLESLRWTGIIVGLIFINLSFLMLYLSPEVSRCYRTKPPHVKTVTHTIPFFE